MLCLYQSEQVKKLAFSFLEKKDQAFGGLWLLWEFLTLLFFQIRRTLKKIKASVKKNPSL